MSEQAISVARAVDSLSAYEFQVELGEEVVGGVFGVEGLCSFVLEGDLPPLVIVKMVQQDPNTAFNTWSREFLDGNRPLRSFAIVAMDEGIETRRWVYRNAFITSITYSEFDTASSELVEERVEVRAERVEEIWPD